MLLVSFLLAVVEYHPRMATRGRTNSVDEHQDGAPRKLGVASSLIASVPGTQYQHPRHASSDHQTMANDQARDRLRERSECIPTSGS